jgi:cyclophilin family peptidyl-prolyl cis-trans isomerase
MRKIIFLLFVAISISACKKKAEEPQVQFTTTEGVFVVKLYKETPQHRDNFVTLVEQGYYDGLLFHKVMKDFLLQTGDPNSKNAGQNRLLGSGGPGYTIPAEIHYPQFFHRKGVLSAARLPDAENPNRESNGSQFYIVIGKKYTEVELDSIEMDDYNRQMEQIWQRIIALHKNKIAAAQGDKEKLAIVQDTLVALAEKEIDPQKLFFFTPEQREAYTTVGGIPFMDKEYTVFGEVAEGLEVLEKISEQATNRNDRPIKDIRIIKAEIIK